MDRDDGRPPPRRGDDLRLAFAVVLPLLAAALVREAGRGRSVEPPPLFRPHALDVNTACAGEIEALPGVGPALAGRIAAARPFAAVEDLARVPGVGPVTLARLRPHVRCVRPP